MVDTDADWKRVNGASDGVTKEARDMVLAQRALLTAEEAAARGAKLANEGQSVPLVAFDLIDHVDPSDWRGLAAVGLQRAIHDQMAAEKAYNRGLPDETDGVDTRAESEAIGGSIRHLLPRQTHPAKDFWALTLSETYRVGSERKSVLDLTLIDARELADTYRARAYGNFQKADAFSLAAKLLTEHKVESVRRLPKAAQQSIAEALR